MLPIQTYKGTGESIASEGGKGEVPCLLHEPAWKGKVPDDWKGDTENPRQNSWEQHLPHGRGREEVHSRE